MYAHKMQMQVMKYRMQLPQRDLERKVDDRSPLVNGAGGQDIDIGTSKRSRVILGQPPTNLDEERAVLATCSPFLLELLSSRAHPVRREVVQHDNLRPGPNGCIRFFQTPTLNLDLCRESTRRFSRSHGARDSRSR